MDDPLWITAHAPTIADLPQPEVRDYLDRVAGEPFNLLVHGPAGAGKTAAVQALARAAHDDPDNDLIVINVADFFDRTKTEIRDDPRFEHFLQGQTEFSKQYRRGTDQRNKYKREWSKREMITHVLKEMAGYQPSSGSFKTILLDNAESIREDFQQSLRRIMERYSETTQFVVATRQPTALIPAIRSRCVPIPMRAPTSEEIAAVITSIADAEDVAADADGVAFVAGYANGDLRAAILGAQTVAATTGEITRETAYETLREIGDDDAIADMLETADAGEFEDARSILDDLLYDEGYEGRELLTEVLRVARTRNLGIDLAALTQTAATVDFDLALGTNDRLHLAHLLADLGAES